MTTDTQPAFFIISFGHVTVTNSQLDNLLKHMPDSTWEYTAMPMIARDRIMAAIKKALGEMTDKNGVIVPEATDSQPPNAFPFADPRDERIDELERCLRECMVFSQMNSSLSEKYFNKWQTAEQRIAELERDLLNAQGGLPPEGKITIGGSDE